MQHLVLKDFPYYLALEACADLVLLWRELLMLSWNAWINCRFTEKSNSMT